MHYLQGTLGGGRGIRGENDFEIETERDGSGEKSTTMEDGLTMK